MGDLIDTFRNHNIEFGFNFSHLDIVYRSLNLKEHEAA